MQRRDLLLVGVVIVAVIGVLFLYTSSQKSATKPAPPISTQPSSAIVPFMTLAQGTQAGILRRVNYQIISAEDLQELWKDLKATTTPPKVNFDTHQVLAIFAGTEPQASLTIKKIEDAHGVRMVSIALTKVDGDCAKRAVKTPLFAVVVVPASPLPLAHEDLIATTSCSRVN